MRGTRARARVRHSDHTRMDALAALLSERPQQQLSATELRSRIALLEAAARACHAELESRTSRLDALPDEIQQVIFALLCNALDPRAAVAYSSASKALREPMQRVGEGAGKSLLQQLKEENEAAAALCLKAGVQSCKALREAKEIFWFNEGLSTTDLATLGKLTPVLPALEKLHRGQLLERWQHRGQLAQRSRSCTSTKSQPQPAPTAGSWWRGCAWARCRP